MLLIKVIKVHKKSQSRCLKTRMQEVKVWLEQLVQMHPLSSCKPTSTSISWSKQDFFKVPALILWNSCRISFRFLSDFFPDENRSALLHQMHPTGSGCPFNSSPLLSGVDQHHHHHHGKDNGDDHNHRHHHHHHRYHLHFEIIFKNIIFYTFNQCCNKAVPPRRLHNTHLAKKIID